MKTAMEELINNLKTIGIDVPSGVQLIFLEKEKEQIKKANLDGYIEGCKHFSFGTDPKPTEQYFNETYQNK